MPGFISKIFSNSEPKKGLKNGPLAPYSIQFVLGTIPFLPMVLKLAGAPGSSSVAWPGALLPILGHFIAGTSIACKYAYFPKNEYMMVMGRGEEWGYEVSV